MPSIGKLLPLRLRAWLRHPRIRGIVVLTVWSLVAAYFLLAALILTTRWYLLPHVADFKDDIARAIGDATGTEVTIGVVGPSWVTRGKPPKRRPRRPPRAFWTWGRR